MVGGTIRKDIRETQDILGHLHPFDRFLAMPGEEIFGDSLLERREILARRCVSRR